ncbi:MAG: DUF58 domain-containing protein [Acidobacteriota bacterium]
MNFVFTTRFYLLLAFGLVILSAAWASRVMLGVAIGYDLLVCILAGVDYFLASTPRQFTAVRQTDNRFSMGAQNEVRLLVTNHSFRPAVIHIRDEFPFGLEPSARDLSFSVPAGKTYAGRYELFADARGDYQFGDIALRYLAPLGLVWRQTKIPATMGIKVYPNIHEAKKNQLYAYRLRSRQMGQHRVRFRGQGREFESLREFVIGDEIRHISWTATARRGKLVTRQYQIERNQNVMIMLDAGRLMTARIERLTKLDHAINAALSISYVAASGGNNIGLLVFCRQVMSYLPPRAGHEQLGLLMEALYNVKPELIEPNYGRAFSYLATNCRRRTLVIILTDLIDRDASAELLAYTATLLPRHLPLIVTIGDKDLRALVRQHPANLDQVFQQSVAEELLMQREEALSRITHLGGLALDVPAGRLALELVNKYLEVKERGLL